MKAGLWARGSWMNDADIFQSSAVIVCVWSSEAKHVLFCSVFFPQAKMVKI